MKSLFLVASLLPAALAAQQEVAPAASVSTDSLKRHAEGFAEANVAKSRFSALHDMIVTTHGITAKSRNAAIVNGKKMVKLGKANISRRGDLTKKVRANVEARHQIVVAVKQRNVDKLEKILYDVSDPQSASYGKHWNRAQITEFTANPASTAFVKKFFQKRGATIVSETPNGEYVTIEAPVKVLEDVFQTQFYEYEQTGKVNEKFVRSEEAFLPQALPAHVQHVFNVIDFPDERPVITQGIINAKAAREETRMKLEQERKEKKIKAQNSQLISGYVTPALLNNYYFVPNNTGSSKTSQAVFESLNQSYSPSDLTLFQVKFLRQLYCFSLGCLFFVPFFFFFPSLFHCFMMFHCTL